MTDREKLIELLCDAPLGSKTFEQQYYKSTITKIADYLINNGVIVAPMPMAEWLRKELTEYVHQRCMEEL